MCSHVLRVCDQSQFNGNDYLFIFRIINNIGIVDEYGRHN